MLLVEASKGAPGDFTTQSAEMAQFTTNIASRHSQLDLQAANLESQPPSKPMILIIM